MPEPLGQDQRYVGGLDGLRALAVVAVIAFHLGFGWAPGGLLGVGVFFTLSGYLITDLLVQQWDALGHLRLADFWLRRARRLLPALVVMLAAVMVWVAAWHPAQLGSLRDNVVAAAGYASNWWLIFHHISYFARFGPPSPLGHLWSLAVEEQFYLAWPWLLWLGLRWVRNRRLLCAGILAGAALSAAAMALLYHPGADPTRVYDGTDTRAFGLLIGAALAVLWPSRPRRAAGPAAGGAQGNPRAAQVGARVVDAVGLLGLAGIVVMVWRVGEYSPFLYRGGMVLLSVATAAAVAAVVYPGTLCGRLLAGRSLRWLGVRSYGIYLWHYPIIVLTTPTVHQGVDLPRSAAQVAATVAVAAVSWRLVEDPIRRGTFGRVWAHSRPAIRGGRSVNRWTWAGSLGALGTLAVVALTGLPSQQSGIQPGTALSGNTISTVVHAPPTTARPSAPTQPSSSTQPATSTTPGSAPSTTAPPDTTSCQAVVHIGDSTSESLVSPDYLPDPSQRIDAQYRQVGAGTVDLEISGARSIVETYEGQPNGYEVAQQLVSSGFRGCWVIALGTNDAADIGAGSTVDETNRIQRMMSVIGNQPVLWVDVVSLLSSGPYAETNMRRWDEGLLAACASYPNLHVYDWASAAQPSWFISDGIHYTSAGSAERAHLIAEALVKAFPANGARSGCVVKT